MDLNGEQEGPKIKKIFNCDGCKWLGHIHEEYKKYSCLHPEVILQYKDDSEVIYKIFSGTINYDLKTPPFCPFLIKKLRKEKLKELKNSK